MHDLFDEKERERLRHEPFQAYRQAISREDALHRGCVLYGAGVEGRLVLSCLKDAGLIPLCFIDRNPELHGRQIGGLMVLPPKDLQHYPDSIIILTSCRVRSIVQDNPFLVDRTVVIWSAINNFCPVLPELPDSAEAMLGDPAIPQAYALMADEISKAIFKSCIKFHINFDEALFSLFDPHCYFAQDLSIDHRRFVDAGAADGDTLKQWLGHGFPRSSEDRYYAFEPSPTEFADLQAFAATLPASTQAAVQLHNAGLGKEAGRLYLSDAGKSSRMGAQAGHSKANGNSVVQIHTLDSILRNTGPTFIKADVEGAEMELLEGARETINRYAPDLAISVYHRYSDLWRIPLWLHQQNSGYTLFLRHHSRAYDDVVCYALRQK